MDKLVRQWMFRSTTRFPGSAVVLALFKLSLYPMLATMAEWNQVCFCNTLHIIVDPIPSETDPGFR